MRLFVKYVFLFMLLCFSRATLAQNIPCVKVYIESILDTFDMDCFDPSSSLTDSLFKITVQNAGNFPIEIPLNASFVYEDQDDFEESTLFFKTYYFSRYGSDTYNHHIASVDHFVDLGYDTKYKVLYSGDEIVFYNNPFYYSGVLDGVNEILVECYFRLMKRCNAHVVYKSNMVSIITKSRTEKGK